MTVPSGPAVASFPAGSAKEPVRVGRWIFDRSVNELSCRQQTLRIEPKVADLLQALIDRRGRVVSRAELLDAVWPGVVVGDEALTQSINKLRRALGETSRAPGVLQTISKRGYRLEEQPAQHDVDARPSTTSTAIASGRHDPAPAPTPTPTPTPTSAPSPQAAARAAWPRRWWMRGVAATTLAAAAALGWGVLAPAPGDDLSAIVARATEVSTPQRAIAEVVIRRFDAIGTTGQGSGVARAFWMQVVAGVSQSQQLRVIADDGASHAIATTAIAPVRYQVDGTVRDLGEQLVVHLVLSNTSSQAVIWSRETTIPLEELSSGHGSAASDLLRALTVRLSESERARLARPYTSSARAFQHFLAGQAAFSTRDPGRNGEAREHYRRALAEDPAFARALAGIALTHAGDATFGPGPERQRSIVRAADAADRAQALDPDLADVHWVRAWVLTQSRDYKGALRSVRRALELNPSHADSYALAATIATYTGGAGEALALMRTAVRLKPVPGFLYHLVLGRSHFLLGDDAQAIANLGAAAQLNAGFLEVRVYLAAALARAGRIDDAAWEAQEVRTLEPGFDADGWIRASLLTDARAIEDLGRALEGAGLRGAAPQAP